VAPLLGDLRTTWTYEGNSACWARDNQFWDNEKLQRARVFSFGYNTGIFAQSTANMYNASDALLFDLHYARADVNKERPIIFIAHSLGGIVVKLVSYKPSILKP
jgi:hypothetical protein